MVFSPADILLPRDVDLTKWAVVACDQYTAQPEYWARVDAFVGDAPSALRLVLPEGRLEQPGVECEIEAIHATMTKYVNEDYFTVHSNAMFYIERTLASGRVRRGLLGKVDLEAYDYRPGAVTPVRATEGTVLDRIPPRVAVRENAPIELPHVLLLMDDMEKTVIEPLVARKELFDKVYSFTLMECGGQLAAWRLDGAAMEQVASALANLADQAAFSARYGPESGPVFLFAAGDGNHSLATAKEHYERLKRSLPPEGAAAHPARYAMAELCNLHDDALEFEPIHRVVFDVEPDKLRAELAVAHPEAGENPGANLPVEALQRFLDDYIARRGGRIDYIHGDDVAAELGAQPGAAAFFLPVPDKRGLFPAVLRGGPLPRKTFSMGHAHEKRFYLEARRIV